MIVFKMSVAQCPTKMLTVLQDKLSVLQDFGHAVRVYDQTTKTDIQSLKDRN